MSGRGRMVLLAACCGVGLLLAILSRVDYVAFHLVAEIAVTVVLVTMFTLAWHTSRLSTNGYLTLVGMAALPIACVVVLHALTYRGMPLLPGRTADMPTQLWLVSRYLTAAALLAAPAFVGRRLQRPSLALAAFAGAAAAAVTLVFTGAFPAAFVPESGLTSLKIVSEYVIIGLFAAAFVLLWAKRTDLAARVYRLLAGAIVASIIAELLFTTYSDVYGIINMLGHLAYLLSFYLLYLALVEVALRRPYEALYRELAQSEQALREANHYSEGLNEIDAAVHATLDSEEILQRVIAKAAAIAGADAAVLGLYESERFRPRYFAGYTGEEFKSISLDRDIGRHIFRSWETGEPVVIADTTDDYRISREFVAATGARAVLASALTVREHPVGGLGFHWRHGPHVPSDLEIDFLRKVAATLSLALENARSFAVEHQIAEALQADLRLAAEGLPGADVGHLYVPAPGPGRIGGDFYDAFRLDEHRLAFLLGDVAGRGLTTASKNAMARSTVRALAYVDAEPSTVLRRAGETLVHQLASGEFATAVFGVLDTATGEVRLALAGHPVPFVCGRADLVPPEAARTVPLGLPFDLPASSWVFGLEPGETLVLYTDGAYEARRGREFFGEERLRAAVDAAGGKRSAQEVAEAVLQAVSDFAGGEIADDLALLVVTYRGALSVSWDGARLL